jgi:ATP-dependent helicase/nuclease subunit B
MAGAGRPRVATIPPGVPFLAETVAALLDGRLGFRLDPATRDFADATIYVPTRRAAAALALAFARHLEPGALLLPRIVPLGDPADLEAVSLASLTDEDTLPPPITPLERRFLLTALVHRWREASRLADATDPSLAASFHLAGELAGLIDEFHIEEADWSAVAGLVPDALDDYWRHTRDFLAIAGQAWPGILAERRLADPAAIRHRLLAAEARRLAASPPEGIVVAAGSTGSQPATARLLAAIARLPRGALILPGLDTGLDAEAFAAIAEAGTEEGARPGHPQVILKRLLETVGVAREDVIVLGTPAPAVSARNRLLSEALRPVEATDRWPDIRRAIEAETVEGLAGVSVIEAETQRQEALAIAVAIREGLEDPAARVALVTPERALARAVGSELGRWGIEAEDSAADPLAVTPTGALLRLLLQALLADFTPLATLALLRAPAFARQAEHDAAVAALELGALRGVLVGPGLAGLRRSLREAPVRRADRHAPPALKRVSDAALAAADALLDRLEAAVAAPSALLRGGGTVAAMADAMLVAFEALCAESAAADRDGERVLAMLGELGIVPTEHAADFADFARIVDLLLAETALGPPTSAPTRVTIYGPLEARLIEADLVILGGLSEGRWPPDARTDAFLNRAMRRQLGLSPPERRIGQSAHDFQMLAGAGRLVLSRAAEIEGSPTIASRLLRRLQAFAGPPAFAACEERGRRLLALADQLEQPLQRRPAVRPDPRPPLARQPLHLSASEVERLYRDPYAIHARRVLGLVPLGPVEPDLAARERGTAIHAALAQFLREASDAWPADPLARLVALGAEEFRRLGAGNLGEALWLPRFRAMAEWFVALEERRRPLIAETHVEIGGRMTIPLADGATLILTAQADRIDIYRDGTAAIIDYKSGQRPTGKQVLTYAAQLPLTAAILRAGGFAGIRPRPVSELWYLAVGDSGERRDKPLDIKDDERASHAPDDVAERAVARLKDFLMLRRRGEEGFLSRRAPGSERHAGDFDHLARVREWQAAGDAEGDGE